MFFRELTALHRHTGIAHQRLRAEPDAQLPAALIKFPEEGLRIHFRKVIFPEDTLWRRVGMDFKWQPFIMDFKFLL
jgi:hypothetical protein